MLMRETVTTTYVCPSCGKRLVNDNGAWRCTEHGAFFAYGPQLLVRAPEPEQRSQSPALPWELAESDGEDKR